MYSRALKTKAIHPPSFGDGELNPGQFPHKRCLLSGVRFDADHRSVERANSASLIASWAAASRGWGLI